MEGFASHWKELDFLVGPGEPLKDTKQDGDVSKLTERKII